MMMLLRKQPLCCMVDRFKRALVDDISSTSDFKSGLRGAGKDENTQKLQE